METDSVGIVHVTATGNLGREVDAEALLEDIDQSRLDETQYNETLRAEVLRFDSGLVALYPSGNYILCGGDSIESMNRTNNQFKRLLQDTGITTIESETTLTVNDVVCVGDVEDDINLNVLVIGLGVAEVEYEPEQFPGLVYRPDDAECVLLVFGTGKVVITGSTSREEAQVGFESFSEMYRDSLSSVT